MKWTSSNKSPTRLLIESQFVTKASEMVSEMNRYFLSKIDLIRQGIQFFPNKLAKCKQRMRGKTCRLGLKFVPVVKVLKVIRNLKNSKSVSVDELDSFSVKTAAEIFAIQPTNYPNT